MNAALHFAKPSSPACNPRGFDVRACGTYRCDGTIITND